MRRIECKRVMPGVPGKQWKGQFTTIQKSGQCSGCGKTIESIQLSPEDYKFLKGRIMRDVIDGGDQYRKTTPQGNISLME
ncbi:Mitochondrial ribonuclease P catalytic subunit [Plecturocebus cupreus]